MYYKALDAGEFPTMLGIRLSEDDEIRRWTIRQLMCNFHLNFEELKVRWGVEYDTYFAEDERALQPFYEDGFLVREPDGLRVLALGKVFVRNICMVFDTYLRMPGGYSAFSRTV
jgi:oxygen-independent coproporphyrinogen-3 oxidase